MNLNKFPRPPKDTGRGVHWSPNQYKWGKENWDFWKAQLIALNIKWVKLMDDGSGSALGLIKRLVDLEIMPVVRIYREEPNPGRINSGNLDFIRKCIELGAVYWETNNEPDLDLEWVDRKKPENWLDIVVDNFIIEASQIRDLGGYLLFPAFGPGGKGNPFEMIINRGRQDLLDGNCCLAIHNYCLGRPLDYPNDPITMYGEPLTQDEWEDSGAMWAWEMNKEAVNSHRAQMANSNVTIMEDSTCFRAFEYFDALVNQAVGHSIPIFTTEGGYNVGQRAGTTFGDDPRYPKPTPEKHGELTLEMFKRVEDAPDYYFACMPWLIAVQQMGIGSPGFENQGPWFTHQFDREFGLNGVLPVVDLLKGYPGKVKQDGPVPVGMLIFNQDKVDRDFADELRYLEPQVSLNPYSGPEETYWKLVKVDWLGAKEGGKGYIYVKCLDEDGNPIENQVFYAEHGRVFQNAQTKGEIDGYWGNIMLTADLGTYKVGVVKHNSDELVNVGLGDEVNPHGERTSFFLTFQWVKQGDIMFDHWAFINDTDRLINDAVNYGVEIVPTSPNENGQYWKVIGVHHLTGEENGGNHHVYVDVLGDQGNRIINSKVGWTWEGRTTEEAAPPVVIDKPGNEPGGNIGLHWNQTVTVWVDSDLPSEVVKNLHVRHADEEKGNNAGHHSFYVVWQLVTVGEEPEIPEPEPQESVVVFLTGIQDQISAFLEDYIL